MASLCVIVHDSAREGEKVCDRVEGGERVKRAEEKERGRLGEEEGSGGVGRAIKTARAREHAVRLDIQCI